MNASDDPFRWKKLGLVFQPDKSLSWMQSHACLPVALQLDNSVHRVYFASRDVNNRSHVGFFDIDLREPERILTYTREPFLAPGPLGGFDDHGIYVGGLVADGDVVHFYTIGWNPGVRSPLFYASIGYARSTDRGTTIDQRSRAPILARSEDDPYTVTGPWVVKENYQWRMWYVSGYKWEESEDGPKSFYHVKHAESDDGIEWHRDGTIAIEHADKAERNIGRPCIVSTRRGYEAWFAYNEGEGYRIGFADSKDGRHFVRKDWRAGIDISSEPWENKAVAHPCIVCWAGTRYMFYNGNQFGRDGVALAVEDVGPVEY